MADYQYQIDTGVIVPDMSQTLSEVAAEFRAVFGQSLSVDPSTPQGMLITRIAEMRDSVARNNCDVANQINPNVAGGVFLDALVGLHFGQRRAASRSTVTATVTGTNGTIIPKGSVAKTTIGARFETMYAVTISGSTSVQMQAIETGPVGADAGTLTKIETAISGWSTVTNPIAATLGGDVESDAQLRSRRLDMLGTQSTSTIAAIRSRLSAQVGGLISHAVVDNPTLSAKTIKGVSIAAKSIAVFTAGGASADIARAIYNTTPAGVPTVGATTVNVADTVVSGYSTPIKYTDAAAVPVLVKVTVDTSPLDLQTIIPELVVDYANGEGATPRNFVIGGDVLPFEIASYINSRKPSINIRNVEITKASPVSWSNSPITIDLNQIPTIQLSSVTVVLV